MYFQQDSQPVGAVMLLKYDVEQTPDLRMHSFAIKKQGAPTLRLAADTEEAAIRWITVVREAVERNDQVYESESPHRCPPSPEFPTRCNFAP